MCVEDASPDPTRTTTGAPLRPRMAGLSRYEESRGGWEGTHLLMQVRGLHPYGTAGRWCGEGRDRPALSVYRTGLKTITAVTLSDSMMAMNPLAKYPQSVPSFVRSMLCGAPNAVRVSSALLPIPQPCSVR